MKLAKPKTHLAAFYKTKRWHATAAAAAQLLLLQPVMVQAQDAPLAVQTAPAAQPAAAESAAPVVQFDISEFVVEGNTLLDAAKIRITLAPFTGAGRDISDISKAADALRALYLKSGYPVVQVSSPAQTIAEGKVLLKVLEDKIISIDVAGNSAYDADNIRASLPALQTGKSFNAKALEADITLANENSAKQVAVNVQPGAQAGELGTTINVTEDRVSKFIATYDNTGNDATGLHKIGLAYQHANLFNRDHAITLQYNGSADNLDEVYSFSLGYHVPFYAQGVSADFIAAYSSSSGQNVNLYFSGKGTVLGTRLNYALPSVGDIRQKLIAGVDYKNSESISGPLVTPITEIPFSLSYSAQVARSEFQGSASATWLRNINGGRNASADDYYNPATGLGARVPAFGSASENFPTTQWQALRLNGTGGFALPNDWQARVGVNTQFSNDLLLPSEQFGAGGANSVRGYPERIISGDQGYSANFELYTPELNRYVSLTDASLRALFFWDVGGVALNDKALPTGFKGNSNIDSLGLGLRMTFRKDITLKLDVGWAQKAVTAAPNNVNPGDARGNIALSAVF